MLLRRYEIHYISGQKEDWLINISWKVMIFLTSELQLVSMTRWFCFSRMQVMTSMYRQSRFTRQLNSGSWVFKEIFWFKLTVSAKWYVIWERCLSVVIFKKLSISLAQKLVFCWKCQLYKVWRKLKCQPSKQIQQHWSQIYGEKRNAIAREM